MSCGSQPCILAVAEVLLSSPPQLAGVIHQLTLQDAVHFAITQNHALKIAHLKVAENEQRKAAGHASYFPSVADHAHAGENTGTYHIAIPAGALGVVDGALVPASNLNLPQGRKNRRESERLARNQMTQGVITVSDRRHASAANYKSQAGLLPAKLYHLIAWTELQQIAGRTPGF
jgi:outer membrane protein TolC